MAALKRKPLMARQTSCNARHSNPLIGPKHARSSSAGSPLAGADNKENAAPTDEKVFPDRKAYLKTRALKPTSLQLCMLKNEPDSGFGSRIWVGSDTPHSGNVWDFSDSEAAPVSSWSTLPNRALLYRPLPVDIGRCTCMIVKERAPEGLGFATLYSLYTYEGQGRQNRKLAVAHRRRRGGRSEFVVARNSKGLLFNSDDSFIGSVKANLVGSRYYIWDQGNPNSVKQSNQLQGVVAFTPTIATWTGSYRSMKAWIPKHQQQVKITNQVEKGSDVLPKAWEGKVGKVHQLHSKVPYYNSISKRYELDFREKARAGLKIQSSVKNFQLTMEGSEKQAILQLGRVGKSTYIMDYRYPFTGYQAFCVCLASIDPKLSCTL